MRYPSEILDEIRVRLPVSAVVGRKVRLKRAGREWKGLSPFNAEKTPSFTINDQKGFYHCFSSGKHGDIFTFVMETEGRLVPGGGRAACRRGRGGAAGDLARGERGREPAQIAARGDGARRCLFRGAALWAGRRRGARLSCPPRAFRRHPAPLPHRLRDARALCAARPPRGEGRRGRGHGRARAPGLGRGRVGALRPLPRPGHVPDRRRARPHRRLRRARHERRRAGEIPQLAGHAALQQGPAALQPAPGARAGARARHDRRRRGLCRRHRDDDGGVLPTPSRRSARR